MRAIVRVALAAAATPLAFGHAGDHGDGFAAGFAHPWGGADHLLAMLAVGAIAAQRGGWRVAAVPTAFVAALAPGAWLAPHAAVAELMVPLTLVALAGLLARPGAPLAVAIAVAALAGLAHGAAHAAEAGLAGGTLAGLVVASAVLHALGLGAALAARRLGGDRPARLAAAGLAAAGVLGAIVR